MASTVMLSIPGYPNYALDTEGNVWSLRYRGTPYAKMMKTRLSRSKSRFYVTVGLWRDGKQSPVRLNRIVCSVYHGPPTPEKPFALHNDHNPLNNDPSNLRWGSHEDNMEDYKSSPDLRNGSKHPRSKLNEQQVMEIRSKRKTGIRVVELAEEYGVHYSMIYYLLKGANWSHVPEGIETGGMQRGEKRPSAKLTEEKVRQIRYLVKNGMVHTKCSAMFGVATSVISEIVNYKSWRHVV